MIAKDIQLWSASYTPWDSLEEPWNTFSSSKECLTTIATPNLLYGMRIVMNALSVSVTLAEAIAKYGWKQAVSAIQSVISLENPEVYRSRGEWRLREEESTNWNGRTPNSASWTERSGVSTGWEYAGMDNGQGILWGLLYKPWEETEYPWQYQQLSTQFTQRTKPSTNWT